MKYFKFALHKRYFDTGFGVLNYAKYPLVLLGIAIPDVKAIVFVALFFGLFCYFLGWWWLNKGMTDAETEVSNQFNPFVRQVRRKFKIKRFK